MPRNNKHLQSFWLTSVDGGDEMLSQTLAPASLLRYLRFYITGLHYISEQLSWAKSPKFQQVAWRFSISLHDLQIYTKWVQVGGGEQHNIVRGLKLSFASFAMQTKISHSSQKLAADLDGHSCKDSNQCNQHFIHFLAILSCQLVSNTHPSIKNFSAHFK